MLRKNILAVLLFVLFIFVPHQTINAEQGTTDEMFSNEEQEENEDERNADEEEAREGSDFETEAESNENENPESETRNEEDTEANEAQSDDDIEEGSEEEITIQEDSIDGLQNGDDSEDVINLKENLRLLGIGSYSEDPSTYFGNGTESNVEEFQAYYGLEPTGIADEETLSTIEQILEESLQEGSTGEDVEDLKQNLTTIGIGNYSENPSDYFGDATEANVKEFQSRYDLLENGIVDAETQAEIDENLEREARNEEDDEENEEQSDDIEEDSEEDNIDGLQNGDDGENVVSLKENLTRVGIGNYPANPSTYFGDATERNVEEFQAYHGLEPTGIVDEETQAEIDENLETEAKNEENAEENEDIEEESEDEQITIQENSIDGLQDGDDSEDVVNLKQNLTLLGIGNYPTSPSTYFGDATERNVEEFQAYYGLEPTGIANEETLTAINQILDESLQDGSSGDDVVDLKQNLTNIGIGNYPENPSDYFGDATEANIKEFQSRYGLLENGIVDGETQAKIDEILVSTYQDGDSGDHIVELKQNLTRLGIGNYPEQPSDYFGDATENNVKRFQAYYGLTENGIVDEETQTKINEILNSDYQDGESGDHIVQLKKDLTALDIGNYPEEPSNYFGDATENNLKEFQRIHGLLESGIADEVTLTKLDELTPPFRDGNSHQNIVEFKKDLSTIGIGNYPEQPSDYFGDATENNVRSFQAYYGLTEDGIAGEETLNKISKILSSPYQDGQSGDHIVQLKKGLTAVGIGNYPENPSDYFGDATERNVEEFQSTHGLLVNGIADDLTLEALDTLTPPYQDGDSHKYIVDLKKGLTAVGIGNYPENPSEYFGDATERNVEEFQSAHGLPVTGIADERTLAAISEAFEPYIGYVDADISLNVREGPGTSYDQVSSIPRGEQITIVHEIDGWYRIQHDDVSGPTYVSGSLVTNGNPDDQVQIFIDPGHGAHDSGGTGNGLLEKDVVLDISLHAAEVLEEEYHGVDVMMSRTTDEFIELQDRAAMANDWGADYFVSVHNNAFNGAASGFESFIFNGNVSNTTIEKQQVVHQYIANELDANDRGMKQENFSVLRNTTMPAILLELLFIDNAVDAETLGSAEGRAELGRITADAIAHAWGLDRR